MLSIQDKDAFTINGFIILLLALASVVACLLIFPFAFFPLSLIPAGVIGFIALTGFTTLQPNEARVITFFGEYVGTIKSSGFLFTLPFSQKDLVPLKLINFMTDHLKVNDKNGNPIEIAAVIVWRVTDAAKASFNVDNYKNFVANQSDTALRALAAHYPYDSETEHSLRGNIDEIAQKLKEVLQEKLSVAGIIIEETKLSHLAYSAEIAMAMLKRQQAAALFQARQFMVENALSMIDEVIAHFETKGNVNFTNDKKADLINSLLVVMTSDKESHPVLNVGK